MTEEAITEDKKARNRDYGRKHMAIMKESGHQRVNFWLNEEGQEIVAKALRVSGASKQDLFNLAVKLLGAKIDGDIERERKIRDTLASMKG